MGVLTVQVASWFNESLKD